MTLFVIRFRRAPARDRELLFRQRNTGDPRVRNFREVERKAAPAAADVEHALAGRRSAAWPRDGASWRAGHRRAIDRDLEIGAAVLQVGVEKQRVEATIEVVMARRHCFALFVES